ncbi:hypothetical protein TPHA_0L00980 [Tetrapisispora phaffii CBS 4417]|uniref:Ketopantoate reductase C-terminal domain-containing protein n=1 Tax=Tetrapisispora phaffii (strain ATCC 24235 / CBS 4417 / NBRC 1672 / NRRL Y-8282 / UCD 70-5) TaxID=1071381 RepID=G8BZX7_TETPH|nr:hypothetical protein TPHA_0L00980 [Tetrapisispora phaffii CBS 4417]CCE65455.1 hypothetical protein TPHA_0L00980 [Tetrapisispora phaffii CBS 4417]
MQRVPRVYAAGSSPLGFYLASQIARIPSHNKFPEVILLLEDEKKLNRFLYKDSNLDFQFRKNNVLLPIQMMASCNPPVYSNGELSVIENLIISAPTSPSFYSTLFKYKNSLNGSSNILLINPEFGFLKGLHSLWKEKTEVPNILIGFVKNYDSFNPPVRFVKEEFQLRVNPPQLDFIVSYFPTNLKNYSYSNDLEHLKYMKEKNPLLKIISKASSLSFSLPRPNKLNVMHSTYGELLIIRMEELIVNSCIDSLTTVYDCIYPSDLLKVDNLEIIVSNVINEQIAVLKREFKFITNIPFTNIALDSKRIYNVVNNKIVQSNASIHKHKLQSNHLNLKYSDANPKVFMKYARYRQMNILWTETIMNLAEEQKQLNRTKFFDYHN